MSPSVLSQVFSWGAIICSALAALTTGLALHYRTIASQLQSQQIATLELETAKANAEAAKAREGVAQSDVQIAKANESAAKANAETARLRIELDREVQKRSQRLLTDEQKSAIADELRGKISEIAIVTQHDLETRAFSLQILDAIPAGVTTYAPEPPREDKWFAPAGLTMFSPLGSNEDQLKDDPLYRALKRVGLFGGTTSKPFLSPDLRGPIPQTINGYAGHVLYIGQKSPF